MDSQPPSDLTQALLLLNEDGMDRRTAVNQVFEVVVQELRRDAARIMSAERANHTLQPTALVNEAYLRLIGAEKVEWQNRAHFFGIAARAMRQVLVDYARERQALKRGGNLQRVTLTGDLVADVGSAIDAIELDDALEKLAERDSRMAQVAEQRILGGMTMEEIGEVVGVTERTVRKDWRIAKMWLARELFGGGAT